MAVLKAKKKEVLDMISDLADKSKSIVFVNFHGLTVSDATDLRRKLRAEGVGYTVAKKTLAKKAFAEKKYSGTMPELTGELAMAYGEDLIAPARGVNEFQKKFEGKISILGGVFESKYMTKSEMEVLANIPPKQTLYGMFVNLINSPIQRMAIVVSEIAKVKTS